MNPDRNWYARKRNSNHWNSNHWLQIALLIGFLFCLVIGAGALAALFIIQAEPETPAPSTALASLPADQIAPQRALERLAGGPAEALAYQAMHAGELDLALVFTAYNTSLDDHSRLALNLSLSRRYLNAQKSAAPLGPASPGLMQTLSRARAIAVLSSGLPSFERAQALGQIAESFTGLEQAANEEREALAVDAAEQSLRIIAGAPDLLPAQRSQLLETLGRVARQLENTALESEVEALVRNPYITPGGTLYEDRWSLLSDPTPMDAVVEDAAQTRRQAVRALIERLNATGGVDYEAERQALAAALQAEDDARGTAYRNALAAGLPLSQQFYWIQEQRNWVALKLQVAHGAFGLSILPDWESNAGAIAQELASLNGNLMTVMEAIGGTLPEPVDQSMLRVESLLWLALQGELGLGSGRAPSDLSDNLRFSQLELIQQGAPPALPLLYMPDRNPPGFRIVTLEELQ